MIQLDKEQLIERFCRYAKVDTQADPHSSTVPSTEKQKNLGRILVSELKELGIHDAEMDAYGYVYATLESTTSKESVPTICFCSHQDTSPDCSGKNVKPIIHRDYDGSTIILPDDPKQKLSPSKHPELAHKIGHDIITASGSTLLGADNKAGIAAIMTAVDYLTKNEVEHGTIKILFTVDEEIGRGVDKVNLKKLNATYGYTIDGEKLGSLENETFSADAATIKITGVSVHPGFAKDKLVSALKIAAYIVDMLPDDRLSPETTSGKAGFIHPIRMTGTTEEASIEFIIRDFETKELKAKADYLETLIAKAQKKYPKAIIHLNIVEQYRNMHEILKDLPHITDIAEKAMKLAGITPARQSIRGGTDGSRLTFMGLPCPNIFAGEYSFHSKQEWTSVQDMMASTRTIIHIAELWAQA